MTLEQCFSILTKIQKVEGVIQQLVLERDKLKKALQFYADGSHFHEVEGWNCAKMGELPPPPELLDRGETAREALES